MSEARTSENLSNIYPIHMYLSTYIYSQYPIHVVSIPAAGS